MPYQHIFLECDTSSMHTVTYIKLSGFEDDQLNSLTKQFNFEKADPKTKEYCTYRATKEKPSMMAVLNYLSRALGFEVFTATLGEEKNQFFLRKQSS